MLPNLTPNEVDLDIKGTNVQLGARFNPANLSQIKENLNLHYTNGLSRYIEKVRVNTVTNITECRKLWEMFSPNSSLFDLWEFRYLFHKSYQEKPCFITLTKGSGVLACLPLFYQSPLRQYTWFGSDWQEDAKFFAVDPNYIPILIYFAPRPLYLWAINKNSALSLPKFVGITEDEPDYFLNLKEFGNMESYLKSLPKKKRYNLKRDHRRITSLKPEIVFNNREHFDKMIKLTRSRFRGKGEVPDFDKDPNVESAFRNLIYSKLPSFRVEQISALIDGKVATTDIVAYYKDIAYPLRGGNDVSQFPGVGNFINYYEINRAFDMNLSRIDFMQYGYGWKKNYLQKEERYKIELP